MLPEAICTSRVVRRSSRRRGLVVHLHLRERRIRVDANDAVVHAGEPDLQLLLLTVLESYLRVKG